MSSSSSVTQRFWMTQHLEDYYVGSYQLYQQEVVSMEQLGEVVSDLYHDARMIFSLLPDALQKDRLNFFVKNQRKWSLLYTTVFKNLERYGPRQVPALVFARAVEELQVQLKLCMGLMRVEYYSPQFANELVARVDLDPARMLPPVTAELPFNGPPVPTLELAV